MSSKIEESKDVIDLRDMSHKKFLAEWNAWVAGTYNIRKATIDNNTTVETGRKVIASNNETANKVQIDKLEVDKADKVEVMKKDVDDSYTALLTTDRVAPMVANQTGFAQNDLYSAVVDLKNTDKVLFNGYSRNFFYTENNGDLYNAITLDALPEKIQYETFDFNGVISVDSDEIKAFAWKFDGNYDYTYIYKTKDMKTWEYDSSIVRVDGVNKVYIKDRRIYFHTGNVAYVWFTEPLTALRSRSIDEYNGSWLVHWNIANGRTIHDIPRPKVDQYGADGIRFSTFAKYNDKIYDVLFYDRNSYFSASPNPDSYQIWVKPIDGNSICAINVGDRFNSIYSGSAIVKENYMFIIASQGYYANNMAIYKVNLLDGTYEMIKAINYNSLRYLEINSDDMYFYLKNESGKHFLRILFNGDTIDEIPFVIENNATGTVAANIFGWAGDTYFIAKQGLQVCLFEYLNNKLVLKKRYSNPCPTVDINYSENLNSDFLIADNFGNKRLSSDNGKSWAATSATKTVDAWVIPFDSDDGIFQIGDKLTWTGLTLKHMRGTTVLKQYTFPATEDYCNRTWTYLLIKVNIQGAYVGKTGKLFVSFYYRNNTNTGSYQSIFLFNSLNNIEDTTVLDLAPAYYNGLYGKHYNFDYMKSYFKDFNKAILTEGESCILLNFETGTLRGNLRGSLSFNRYENILSNGNEFVIQQNEYSGSMNTKDIVVMYSDETYVQIKLPYLPAKVKIQRFMKKIGNKFFLFYANGMAFSANESDLITDPINAFTVLPTGILGKLNDIAFNNQLWLAVGDKGMFRVSEDLNAWFGYDISRYNTPDSNMFGFDITKANLKPTRSLDFKIDGSSKMSLDKTYKSLKTINGIENEIVKTELEGIAEATQSNVSEYGELTLNNADVKYESMEYPSTYNAIAGNSVKVCRVPYNWRGKRIVVEFEAKKTNSTVNALASFCYDGTSVPIKECKKNTDNTTWVKYLGTIVLPATWDKTRLKNGEKYHTDINTTIVGAFIDIGVADGNWDVKNIKVTLGEISRPLQFATDSSECHLFNVPEAWRGCELEITYDLYNKGGERGTSVDVANGPGVSNWIIRGGEDTGLATGKSITKSGYLPYYINTVAAINNSFKNLLYKSPRVGATLFTRSLNSNANTLDFFEQNGFTIDFLSGKTLSDLSYFDFGISGGGNIIVGSSKIEFKNFKAKIKSIENTFDFFETGGVTFGDTSKFTLEELIIEKNIK